MVLTVPHVVKRCTLVRVKEYLSVSKVAKLLQHFVHSVFVHSKSLPSTTDNYEYDDIKGGPGKPSSEAAAKPNSCDASTYSVQEEQPFDDDVYNVPFSPPNSQVLGPSFTNL